jgi:transcriptional regulator with XRE-family HTH domain
MNLSEQLEHRRNRLRLPKTLVATRAGLSLATVNRLLSGQDRRIGVDSVSAVAAVLGLEVILGARPRVTAQLSPTAFREERARMKAKRLVGVVRGTMALEAEGVSAEEAAEMEQETVHELLAGSARRLWSD